MAGMPGRHLAAFLVVSEVRGALESNGTNDTMRIQWFASPRDYNVERAPAVALCVAGQARTYSHPRVQGNWEETMFSTLDPDIFFHASHQLRRCKRRDPTQLERFKNLMVPVCLEEEWSTPRAEMDAILKWLRRWRLVQVSVMHDDDILRSGVRPAPADLIRAPRSWQGNVSRPCPVPSQNMLRAPLSLRWWGCYMGILRAERELRNRQYDMVMRLRPDLFIPCKMPASFAPRLRTDVIAAFNDFGWIAARGLGLGALGLARYSPAPTKRPVCPPSCGERTDCFDYHVITLGGGRIFMWEAMHPLNTVERYGAQPPGMFESVVAVRQKGEKRVTRVTVTCFAELKHACRAPPTQNCTDLVGALTAAPVPSAGPLHILTA